MLWNVTTGSAKSRRFVLTRYNVNTTLNQPLNQVWDVVAGAMLHRSCIESPVPFLCLHIDDAANKIAVGAGNGVVKFFSLDSGYRCLGTYGLVNSMSLTRSTSKSSPPGRVLSTSVQRRNL